MIRKNESEVGNDMILLSHYFDRTYQTYKIVCNQTLVNPYNIRVYKTSTGKGSYVMVDKVITQDETSKSQNRLLTSKIVGDLSTSTICCRQLHVVISLLKVF